MKEKIFTMLQSGDIEMVQLGIFLCFEEGPDWIKANIPSFGPTVTGPLLRSDCKTMDAIMYKRGNIGIKISISGLIDARDMSGFLRWEKFKEI